MSDTIRFGQVEGFMEFDALEKLGEEKLSAIVNELILGRSVRAIARTIQDWGGVPGCSPAELFTELTNLRASINRGGANCNRSEASWSKAAECDFQIVPLDELTPLITHQKDRMEKLFMQEREQAKPLPALSQAVNLQALLLLAVQDLRFDLGLDPYKRIELTFRELQKTQEEKERQTNEHVINAARGVNEIFTERRRKAKGAPTQ